MYRHCIYCSAELGTNEALEAFPVGRTLAFDAARGRLWAVCGKCARWNLAPIEDRWEPVEEAERLFTDTRLRVQSENVGLAKLRDGTRLVRIGAALPGELAAWRYGGQLTRRRRQYIVASGFAAAGGVLLAGGASMLAGGMVAGVLHGVYRAWRNAQRGETVFRLPAAASPTSGEVVLRAWHASAAVLEVSDEEDVQLRIPDPARAQPREGPTGRLKYGGDSLVLSGAVARAFLARGMVHVNRAGAGRKRLGGAAHALSEAGSAEAFIRRTAAGGGSLAKRGDMPRRHLTPVAALALEMALHEERERRALEGELAVLEAAWRDAEEIAAIADRLAFLHR